MAWYFVESGARLGPFDDAQWRQLTASGRIQPGTLVWRDGLAAWVTFQQLTGGTAEAALGTVCSRCGRSFAPDDLMNFNNLLVCAECKPAFLQNLREGTAPMLTAALRYAGFWRRFAAVFLDGLILGVVQTIIQQFVLPGNFLMREAVPMRLSLLLNGVSLVIALVYETLLIGAYGATLGKMALRVRVVTPAGERISYGRALGRRLAKIVSFPLTAGVGYIFAASDPQGRALHDSIAGTRVITTS